MGSIGGGGRYDDLTGLFDVPNLPGVGISFGVDRIYDVMEELKLFPAALQTSTQVLFFNLGDAESKIAYNLLQQLRNKILRAKYFTKLQSLTSSSSMRNEKIFQYIIIIGSKELEADNCIIKNIKTGEQETIHRQNLFHFILNKQNPFLCNLFYK